MIWAYNVCIGIWWVAIACLVVRDTVRLIRRVGGR